MQKIVALLNENTILDFKMIFQLIKRYKIHFYLAMVFLFTVFAYNYISQPVVFEVAVPMKVLVSHKVATDLSSLLPVENTNVLNFEEINISLSSLSFLKFASGLILKTKEFDSLNFGGLNNGMSLLGKAIKDKCRNDSGCIVNELAGRLRGLFYIDMGLTENRFILKTNTIDKLTSFVLANTSTRAIESERAKILRYSVLKEAEVVGNLIQESRSVIEKMGGYKALEDQERLQNNIQDLKEKIRMLQANISIEMVNYNSLRAEISENIKSTKKVYFAKETYEGYLKNQARINEIKLNLSSLMSIAENKRSPADKSFIAQLLSERARLLQDLPPEKKLKTMELGNAFSNKQKEDTNSFEFDFLVSKNKISSLNIDYNSFKNELNSLVQEKLANENKVNGMRTDLDFLKNLDAKQSSLKLLSATINSDLLFEESNQLIAEFRKFTLTKVLFFSFSITALFYFLSLVIRFVYDDRVYGKDEIRMHFQNLDFIGEVPSFEKL